MIFTYDPVSSRPPVSVYHIEVEYSHGDADFTSTNTFSVKTENDLQVFLTKFQQFADMIDNCRAGGSKLPRDFADQANAVYGFELERDQVYSNAINYFAAISLKSVVFFDEFGTEYIMSWS